MTDSGILQHYIYPPPSDYSKAEVVWVPEPIHYARLVYHLYCIGSSHQYSEAIQSPNCMWPWSLTSTADQGIAQGGHVSRLNFSLVIAWIFGAAYTHTIGSKCAASLWETVNSDCAVAYNWGLWPDRDTRTPDAAVHSLILRIRFQPPHLQLEIRIRTHLHQHSHYLDFNFFEVKSGRAPVATNEWFEPEYGERKTPLYQYFSNMTPRICKWFSDRCWGTWLLERKEAQPLLRISQDKGSLSADSLNSDGVACACQLLHLMLMHLYESAADLNSALVGIQSEPIPTAESCVVSHLWTG